MGRPRSNNKKSHHVQFRVDGETLEKLEVLSSNLKADGAKNASVNVVARSLIMAALGNDKLVATSNEVVIEAWALQKRLVEIISRRFADELPDMLDEATGD